MPKQPVLYEAMYILDSALDESGVQTAVETLEKFVADNGGEVVATREFAKRRLAYEIEGHTTGTYMILYFKSFGELVAELQLEMRLVDGVVRDIICVANPKAPFDPKPEPTPEEIAAAEAAEAAETTALDTETEVVAELAGELEPSIELAPVEEAEVVEEASDEVAEAPAEEAPAVEEAPAEVAEAPAEEAPAEVAEAPAAEEAPATEEEA